jgi:uncharacterized protein YbaR (Trm112 family)
MARARREGCEKSAINHRIERKGNVTRDSCRQEKRSYGGVMAVSKELLDILVCPLCKTPVKLTGNEQGLKCGTCRRVYPIRGDIPIMLVDEARIEAE